MRFQLDYDLTTIYHIHSQLSLCSKDPEQNLENILRIAKDLGLRVLQAPGLPGRTAPVTAAAAIRDSVYHILWELEA